MFSLVVTYFFNFYSYQISCVDQVDGDGGLCKRVGQITRKGRGGQRSDSLPNYAAGLLKRPNNPLT